MTRQVRVPCTVNGIVNRLTQFHTRLRKVRYVAVELLLSRLLTKRKMRIFFSDEEGAKHLIEKGFRHTRHEVAFGEFTPESVARYDLLVPLTIRDLDRLNAMRPLIEKNPLPIPSAECVRLCDDKTLLNRFLIEKGFGEFIPRTEGDFEYPYLLKKRIDEGGRDTTFVTSREQESELLSALAMEDYFRQEIVPGKFEYASHVLLWEGRIRRSLSFRYELKEELSVKRKVFPIEQKMIPCPFPDLFASILGAVGFEGLCCIDYRIWDGRPLIMEINPRFGGSLRLYFFSYIRSLR